MLAIPSAAQAFFFWGHHHRTVAFAGPVAGGLEALTIGDVNMRTCASTSCRRIMVLPEGTEVWILGSTGGWYEVSYGGYEGFVSARYVSTAVAAVPPAPTVAYASTGFLPRTATYSSLAVVPQTVAYASTAVVPETVTYASNGVLPQTVGYASNGGIASRTVIYGDIYSPAARGYQSVGFGRYPTAIRPVRTLAPFYVPEAYVPAAGGYETTLAATGALTFASSIPPLPVRGPDFGYCGTPVWDGANDAWFDGCRWGYNNGWYVAPPLVVR
jgi:hypothetical protein